MFRCNTAMPGANPSSGAKFNVDFVSGTIPYQRFIVSVYTGILRTMLTVMVARGIFLLFMECSKAPMVLF